MTSNTPPYKKVAVGVCTYNRSSSLKRLLDSLMKLDYPSYEIIVVDNNSTDDTEVVVKSYPNVIYVKEKRRGIAFARNKLLDVCPSDIEFLGMVDDDETLESDWICKMLDCFELNSKIIAVGGPYIPIYEVKKPNWMPDNFFAYKNDIKGCRFYQEKMIFCTGNCMIKINIVKIRNVLFDENLGYNGKVLISGEDVDFFNKLITKDDFCGFTEFAFVKHYIDRNRLTFKWILRRFYLEGVTQYFRFGRKELLHNIVQLPLKFVALLFSAFTFNVKTISKRFFKLVMCVGVCSGVIYKNNYRSVC